MAAAPCTTRTDDGTRPESNDEGMTLLGIDGEGAKHKYSAAVTEERLQVISRDGDVEIDKQLPREELRSWIEHVESLRGWTKPPVRGAGLAGTLAAIEREWEGR